MSESVGQVYFAKEKRSQFLDMAMGGEKEYSEATAELIDKEIKSIINTQYEKALNIIREKRSLLEKAVLILLEKEKIDGDELKALMETGK